MFRRISGLMVPLWLLASLLLPILGEAAEILPVDQAFKYSVSTAPNGDAVFEWTIDDCCYLYRDKFKFRSKTPGIEFGTPLLPAGKKKHDEFFGEMEVYRGRVEIRLPVLREKGEGSRFELDLGYQGCSDQGICYPPQKRVVTVGARSPEGAAAAAEQSAGVLDELTKAFRSIGTASTAGALLPADQAFRFVAQVQDPRTLYLGWQIADGYYLYREKFRLALVDAGEVQLGAYEIPRGEPKQDEEFGAVEVFHREVGFTVPLLRGGNASSVHLRVGFQGCADRGVCYPPMEREVNLELPAQSAALPIPSTSPKPAAPRLTAEQDRIAQGLGGKSAGLTVLSFLGFGLLLAFTPCMFPMIPILSGIIVGQGEPISTRRAFLLSLSYVLASAATYTVLGVLAGLFGQNLQAIFQTPWVIALFSTVFVLLALAMFGFFQLQIPTFVQSRIAVVSSKQRRGSLSGAAIMGGLSALVMGPCVAPPLAGALIYIGDTGDAWLGGTALFALGFGMGIPLLIIGASAGKLLPKVGIWMNAVRSGFAVGLLAVAVWLLERIVPAPVALFLWALLLILPAVYLGALDALPQAASGWRKLCKGIGVVMLAYGILLLVGVATDADDPLQPLRGFLARGGTPAERGLVFEKVRTLAELERRLVNAQGAGKWVMLDYYADWCVSCKEMERYTFADPAVQAALANVVLLQADVTANSPDDQAMLRRFALIGPPATLFFGPDREERTGLRVVGYLDPDRFLEHVRRIPSCILEC